MPGLRAAPSLCQASAHASRACRASPLPFMSTRALRDHPTAPGWPLVKGGKGGLLAAAPARVHSRRVCDSRRPAGQATSGKRDGTAPLSSPLLFAARRLRQRPLLLAGGGIIFLPTASRRSMSASKIPARSRVWFTEIGAGNLPGVEVTDAADLIHSVLRRRALLSRSSRAFSRLFCKIVAGVAGVESRWVISICLAKCVGAPSVRREQDILAVDDQLSAATFRRRRRRSEKPSKNRLAVRVLHWRRADS